MENELDLDLDNIEAQEKQKLPVKDRFAKLSSDYSQTKKEKEEVEVKLKTESDAKLQAEKERDFYKSFSQISSKHPEATNYQEQILERVNKGMDTEEATVAVLYKEGKLNVPQPQVDIGNVAGGSAPNTPGVEKNYHDMNLEEKRKVMLDLEKTGALERLLTHG